MAILGYYFSEKNVVAHTVSKMSNVFTCNLYLSRPLVTLAPEVMQNDRDFVEVIYV